MKTSTHVLHNTLFTVPECPINLQCLCQLDFSARIILFYIYFKDSSFCSIQKLKATMKSSSQKSISVPLPKNCVSMVKIQPDAVNTGLKSRVSVVIVTDIHTGASLNNVMIPAITHRRDCVTRAVSRLVISKKLLHWARVGRGKHFNQTSDPGPGSGAELRADTSNGVKFLWHQTWWDESKTVLQNIFQDGETRKLLHPCSLLAALKSVTQLGPAQALSWDSSGSRICRCHKLA